MLGLTEFAPKVYLFIYFKSSGLVVFKMFINAHPVEEFLTFVSSLIESLRLLERLFLLNLLSFSSSGP